MNRQITLAVVLVLSILCALGAAPAKGQAVYGSIIGTVTDPQGAAVVGATVTVTSTTKGTSDQTTTNDSGFYTVTHLIPDKYSIKIEVKGFKTYAIASVDVSADTSAHVDAQMQVGEVTQSVEVTGELPQLETDRADVSNEFNQMYVSDLPILNRNFTSLELLTPGTQKLVGWSHAATENPQAGQQIFVDGQHFSGTAFMLDGTDNQDAILGIIVVNPNIDAIQETKITLQDYDAEFGKAVAGLVTVQTKSGTNEFHGGGFYDYRNSAQQARDPFTQPASSGVPHATYKAFGAQVGGPIIKDKLFFFGDYQGVRQINGITNLLTTPNEEALKTCNPATNASSDTPGYCNLSAYTASISSGGGLIYNPTTSTNPLTGAGRTPFCGPAGCATEPNWIPIGMISPQAAAVLAEFPAPNNGSGVTNNFVGSGSGPYDQNAFDIRIDYSAPHDYHVFGRFSLDYFHLTGLGTLGELGGVGFGPGGLNGESTNHDYSLASGFDKAIGTNLLTDFRFGYFKYNPVTAYSDANKEPMNGFGIPGLNLGTTETGGLSSFFLNGNGGFSSFGDGLNVGRCNCPLIESEQQFQFVNNWTKIKGNHQIKFGADIRYAMNLRVPSDSNRTGILNFDANGTSLAGAGGLSLATFLLGDVTSFQRYASPVIDAAERQKRWFFYGEDTWRVTSKLTFNYGLRWEIYFPESVNGKGNGGFANLTQGVIRVAGYGPYGTNGNIDNTWKAFGPRMAIAYQYDPKTVVRMGYGRSFDLGVFGSNFGHAVTQNLPVLAAQSLEDSNINPLATNNISPVFTLASGPPASLNPTTYFSNIFSEISPQGTLPLLGPQGTAATHVRPTVQRLPTIDAWNATVQRQVTPTIAVEIGYVGNKGTHVIFPNGPSYNINAPAVGNGTNPVTCTAPGACSLTSFTPFVPQANRRPLYLNGVPAFSYPGYFVTEVIGGVPTQVPLTCCAVDVGNYYGNDASTNYNSLQTKVEKRFSDGLQFMAHYTFSHSNAYDTTQGYYNIAPKIEYGPDQYNRDQVFLVTSVYQLPIGQGKKFLGGISRAWDYVIGGWQVSNTLTWASGLPWTATIGECGEITDTGPCRPNLVPGQSFSVGKRTITSGCATGGECGVYWFTPVAPLTYNFAGVTTGTDSCTLARPVSGAFSLPACGQIGNAGFDTFIGPRAFFSDLSLMKNFKITERLNVAFRFDAYNVFNHPVLGFNSNQGYTCVDCSTNPNAGRITDIESDATPGTPSGMRQLQFGLRVIF
ncbi:MAG TPA: TonB-dependent receptor [Candidatus Eremiobacteraceae bacterium]|nr:TonB-dependent receptor [Candidatus Eremiobacteraceae bacterium]